MTTLEYPSWQGHLLDALLESQPEELQRKMEAAEAAIFYRFQELASQGNHDKERAALNEALPMLLHVQVEKLHFPRIPKEFLTR